MRSKNKKLEEKNIRNIQGSDTKKLVKKKPDMKKACKY